MSTHHINTLDFFLIKQKAEINNMMSFVGTASLSAKYNKLTENIYNIALITFLLIGYPFSSLRDFFVLNKYSRRKIEYDLTLLSKEERLCYWKELKESFVKEMLDRQLFCDIENIVLTFSYIESKYFKETYHDDHFEGEWEILDTKLLEGASQSDHIDMDIPVEIECSEESQKKNPYERYYLSLDFIYESDSPEFDCILSAINDLRVFKQVITKNTLSQLVSGTLCAELKINNQRIFCVLFDRLQQKGIVHPYWQSYFINQPYILSKKGERLTQKGLSTAATYKDTSKIRIQTKHLLDKLELSLNNLKK